MATMTPEVVQPTALREAMRAYPTGVVLVAAEAEGRPVGMVANSFTSVSLDPPLVSVSFMRSSSTWRTLQRTEVWGISVLPDDRPDLLPALSAHASRRFEVVDVVTAPDGAVLLPGSPLRLVVTPHAEVEAGDHILVLLRVLDVQQDPARTALVLHHRPVNLPVKPTNLKELP